MRLAEICATAIAANDQSAARLAKASAARTRRWRRADGAALESNARLAQMATVKVPPYKKVNVAPGPAKAQVTKVSAHPIHKAILARNVASAAGKHGPHSASQRPTASGAAGINCTMPTSTEKTSDSENQEGVDRLSPSVLTKKLRSAGRGMKPAKIRPASSQNSAGAAFCTRVSMGSATDTLSFRPKADRAQLVAVGIAEVAGVKVITIGPQAWGAVIGAAMGQTRAVKGVHRGTAGSL